MRTEDRRRTRDEACLPAGRDEGRKKDKFIIPRLSSFILHPSVLCFLTSIFCFLSNSLLYAGSIDVPQGLSTSTTTITPQVSQPSSVEGRVYYDGTNPPYFYDGTTWQSMTGSGDKYVATKIVSAYNSRGATRDGTNPCIGDGTACNNPKSDYTADGVNDQTTIQQAIDDLGVNPGAVYLLEGTFNIADSINFNNIAPDDSGKAIIGTGAGTVLKIVAGSSNINVINASGVSRTLISQLRIDGNSKTGTNNNGIYFSGATYSKINNVLVENIKDHGIYLSGFSNNNIISGNKPQNNSKAGIYLYSSSNNILSNNNTQSNGWDGILLEVSSNNNIISGNNLRNNTSDGIEISSSSYNTVSGNQVVNNSDDGIDFYSSSNYNIASGNMVYNNGTSVDGYDGNGIDLDTNCNNNVISGNILRENSSGGGHGIYLSSSANNNISGNLVYDSGGAGTYDGIRLTDSDVNLISSNRILDSSGSGYGINLISNTCDNNYLFANFIDGTGYTGAGYDRRIKDSGTATQYTQKEKITFEPRTVSNVNDGLANGQILNPRGPASYIKLNPSANISLSAAQSIADGKAIGDILIIENISPAFWVEFSSSAKLRLTTAPLTLNQNDILKLLWNGSAWIELAYSDN